MRKIAPVAFLTAGFLVFGGLWATPASAEDEEDSKDKTSLVSPKPINVKDHEGDEEGDEDDEKTKKQNKTIKNKKLSNGVMRLKI